jgi:hypothetical protein
VEEGSADEYNRLLYMIKNADPTSDGFFDQFDRLIDFDNLIDYFTAQLYFANMDWPQSNLELWKFRNDTAKWRYFFFDSDAGMQWVNYDHLTEYNNDHDDFQRFEDYAVIILKTLMNNEQFRKLFYSRFYYLLSTTFSTENVMTAINHYESLYAPLVPEHIYRWHNPVEYRKWEENVDWLKSFAIQRPLILAEQLQRNFGDPWTIYPNPCRGSFTIEFISPVSNCDIRIYSTSGLLLREWKNYNRNSCTFSCNTDLPAGLYIVKGSAGTCVFIGKLIVQ